MCAVNRPDEDGGDQQDVDGVEARDDRLAGERAAEDAEGEVGADHRGRLHEALHGAQAGAGEQVVGEGVAGEALDDGEQRQHRADDPVELTRLAEGAGEEHPEHVHRQPRR